MVSLTLSLLRDLQCGSGINDTDQELGEQIESCTSHIQSLRTVTGRHRV
jgi:hypothetical protein